MRRLKLTVDPIWLARVRESARNFAKACDQFKEGLKEGRAQERERKVREAIERQARARPRKTSPDEEDRLQPHWHVKCVDCGLRFSFAWKITPPGYESARVAAVEYLQDRGWVPRGCGRWKDHFRCFGCAKMARNGD